MDNSEVFDPSVIVQRRLRDLHDHWARLPRDGGLPRRAALDPVDIPSHLPLLALVETAPAVEDFRFRLWGTGLNDAFGDDRTGRTLGQLVEVENIDVVAAAYAQVRDTGRPHYDPDRPIQDSRAYVGYARLTLPLTRGGAAVDMLLVGFSFHRRRGP